MGKCFQRFHGYEVKDAKARKEIQENKSVITEQHNQADVKVWVGSYDDYRHIEERENNTIYLTTGRNVLYSTDGQGVGVGDNLNLPDIDKFSIFAIKVRCSIGECVIFAGKSVDMLDVTRIAGMNFAGGTNKLFFKVSCTVTDTGLTVEQCAFDDSTVFENDSNAYINEVIGIM